MSKRPKQCDHCSLISGTGALAAVGGPSITFPLYWRL